jgi:hypothetical protein
LQPIEARQHNAGCFEDNDDIIPPRRGAQNPPPAAPTTVHALYNLSAAQLNVVEAYYGIPQTPNFTTQERRRRLAKTYGVTLTTVTSVIPASRR